MQELAFLLTGLAGAASAVAFAKFPKNTHSLKIIGANPRIQREIAYMEVERDILAKLSQDSIFSKMRFLPEAIRTTMMPQNLVKELDEQALVCRSKQSMKPKGFEKSMQIMPYCIF